MPEINPHAAEVSRPKGLTPRDANATFDLGSPGSSLRVKAAAGDLTPSTMRMHELLEWKARRLIRGDSSSRDALKDTSSPSFLELLPSYEKAAKTKANTAAETDGESAYTDAPKQESKTGRTRGAAPSAEQSAQLPGRRPTASGRTAPRSLLARPRAVPAPSDGMATPTDPTSRSSRRIAQDPGTNRAVVGTGGKEGRGRARARARGRVLQSAGHSNSVVRRQQSAAARHAARLESQRRRDKAAAVDLAEAEARLREGKQASGSGSGRARGRARERDASGGRGVRVKRAPSLIRGVTQSVPTSDGTGTGTGTGTSLQCITATNSIEDADVDVDRKATEDEGTDADGTGFHDSGAS